MKSFSLSLFVASLLTSTIATSGFQHSRHAIHLRGRHDISPVLTSEVPNTLRRRANSKRCVKKGSSGVANAGAAPTNTATPTSPPPTAGKPAGWPTVTQAGATYSATASSAADPMLMSVSEALNNMENAYFTSVHTGDLTYYGQGLGACGDTYDDSTYTAAISMLMYDTWPGATASRNRNPVCGPFSPGRSVLNPLGLFTTAVESELGLTVIGGDGFPNCDPTPGIMCHIPLTVTITNPANGKSVVAKIVDRCVGCAPGDIDVTPTVYNTIADPVVGRTHGITWQFNQY